MKKILRLIPLCMLMAVACEDSDSPAAPEPSIIDQIRNALAPYQDLQFAIEAGYENVSACMEDPILGGMGIHYAKEDLIFSRGADAFRPEMLVYEPLPDGTYQLVAVEYFVPARVWGSDDPPTLFNRPLLLNEEFDAYTLHVWLWKQNPSGLFADWNPDVTCDYAAEIQPRSSAEDNHAH